MMSHVSNGTNTFQQTLPTLKEDLNGEKKLSKPAQARQSRTCPLSSLHPTIPQKSSNKTSATFPSMTKAPDGKTNPPVGTEFESTATKDSANVSSAIATSNLSMSSSCKELGIIKEVTEPNSDIREESIMETPTTEIDTVANVNKENSLASKPVKCTRKNTNNRSKPADARLKKQASSSRIINKPPNKQSVSSIQKEKKVTASATSTASTNLTSTTSKLPSNSDLAATCSTKDGANSNGPALIRKSTLTDIPAVAKKSEQQMQTASGQPVTSRLSFSTVTRRVTTLLKFKRGFLPTGGGEREKPPSPPPEPLPSKPRFSAFMSAEAQFALLKGYEDILAEKLVDQFPSETALIQRTKTPRHSIAIAEGAMKLQGGSLPWADRRRAWKDAELTKEDKQIEEHSKETEEKKNGDMKNAAVEQKNSSCTGTEKVYNSNGKSSGNTSTLDMSTTTKEEKVDDPAFSMEEPKKKNESSPGVSVVSTGLPLSENCSTDKKSTPASEKKAGSPRNADPSPIRDAGRRSMSFSNSDPSPANGSSPTILSIGRATSQLRQPRARRFSSLPEMGAAASSRHLQRLLPRDRLLTMTHRMEKAMDILDVLRSDTELALSPRVKEASGAKSQQRQQKQNHQQKQQQQQQQQQQLCQPERRLSQSSKAEPLKDFNRWAGQWSLEFRADTSN